METLIVILIVGIVAVMAARSFYRTMSGKNDGCGCGEHRPMSGNCAEDKRNHPQGKVGGQ